LQQVAALWVSKGEDMEFSIRLHRAMAKQTRHKAFAHFLEKRAERLENLLLLDRAIDRYRDMTGKPPSKLQQLVDRAILPAIPSDPFSVAYVIDSRGKAQVVQQDTEQGADVGGNHE